MTLPVVLINMFEVIAGQEEAFLIWWQRSSEALQREPGFLDATLHHSLQSGSRFAFINIAHWENAEALDRARLKNSEILQPTPVGKGHPGLYEIVFQYK